MLTALRPRLSYANVMSTLAVSLALGGGAAIAAGLERDSVKSKQIKDGRVKTRDLAADAATGEKVAEATLGTVPSATNADTLGDKSAAELEASSAFDQNASPIEIPAALTSVAQATITTQGTGRVLASGSVELSGAEGNERGSCDIDIDGADSIDYETTFDDIGLDNEAMVPVAFARNNLPAGEHTATLRCESLSGTISKDDAAINVIGIPVP